MRSCKQYIPLLQAQQSAVRGSLNPNGSAHTFSMVALPATTIKEFYICIVCENKDMTFPRNKKIPFCRNVFCIRVAACGDRVNER